MKTARAEIYDRVDAGGEGQGRDEHLVAWPDAGQQQRQVQRGCARAECSGMVRPNHRRKFLLERIDVRAKRRNPVGGESVLDILLLPAGHMGRGKVDALHFHSAGCQRPGRSGFCVRIRAKLVFLDEEIGRNVHPFFQPPDHGKGQGTPFFHDIPDPLAWPDVSF